MTGLVTEADIAGARARAERVPQLVRRTPLLRDVQLLCPVLRAGGASAAAPAEIALKLESQQIGGSFKMRGVVNQLAALPPGVRGCVTFSAGNFARSCAYAAAQQGIPLVVCMPTTVPPERVSLVRSLGARVELVPSSELLATVQRIAAAESMLVLHPFDAPELISGYGAIGLEILDELPGIDVVLVPCGGGGLLSGVAAAIKLAHPRVRIIGVEPEGAPKMHQSLAVGRPVTLAQPPITIASGLAPPFAGTNTFAHVRAFVDDLVLVDDADIRHAVRVLFRAGLVVEPSGAAAVAALVVGKAGAVTGKRVCCIVSGSNVSAGDLAQMVAQSEQARL